MNLAILNKYDIQFENSINFGKLMISPNSILNQLAIDTRSKYDLDDTIGALEMVLDGSNLKMSFVTDSLVTVDFDKFETRFYDHPDYNDVTEVIFRLPTGDLKSIILSRKEFVL